MESGSFCTQWGSSIQDPGPVYGDPEDPSFDAPAQGVELAQTYEHDGVSSSYHVFTRGVDFSKPVGMVIRMHGDGGEEYDYPEDLTACLASVAANHNMILVVPRTPDEETATWWKDIPNNLDWLGGLLEDELYRKYPSARDNTWWMGYSGGSEMLTFGILAEHPEWVTKGAIMMGGGGAPTDAVTQATPKQKQSLDLTWVTGINDTGDDEEEDPFDAIGEAKAGSEFYSDEGFQRVYTNWAPGIDHHNLPDASVLEQKLAGMLRPTAKPAERAD